MGPGPRIPPRCLEWSEKSLLDPTQRSQKKSGGVRKKFQMTHFTMPNNLISMKFSPKSGPGLADVGVLHGEGDGSRAPP